jgi:hypothetical protein
MQLTAEIRQFQCMIESLSAQLRPSPSGSLFGLEKAGPEGSQEIENQSGIRDKVR